MAACDTGEAFEDSGGWGVEVLVGDAVDAAVTDGAEMVPVTLRDDSLERDAIPCPAPGKEEDIGLVGFGESGDVLRVGVGTWFAEEEVCAGGFDQLGYPVLGVDEGLAPTLRSRRWVCEPQQRPRLQCWRGFAGSW